MVQEPGSLILIILIIAATAVIFWRTVLKLVTIGLILLIMLGFVELLRDIHLVIQHAT
jgi:hypothetical protein